MEITREDNTLMLNGWGATKDEVRAAVEALLAPVVRKPKVGDAFETIYGNVYIFTKRKVSGHDCIVVHPATHKTVRTMTGCYAADVDQSFNTTDGNSNSFGKYLN